MAGIANWSFPTEPDQNPSLDSHWQPTGSGMMLDTLMPFLYLEKEKGKDKHRGHKKEKEVLRFPSGSEIRNVISMCCW